MICLEAVQEVSLHPEVKSLITALDEAAALVINGVSEIAAVKKRFEGIRQLDLYSRLYLGHLDNKTPPLLFNADNVCMQCTIGKLPGRWTSLITVSQAARMVAQGYGRARI